VSEFVDISRAVHDGMDTYPGLPRPVVSLHRRHSERPLEPRHAGGFAIGHLDCVGNVGTYIDSPYHLDPEGDDVSEIPLARLVELPTTIIDLDPDRCAADDLLGSNGPLTGRAVLIRTRWDRRWGTPAYWEPAPFLTGADADRLVAAGPAIVGIDTWNIDDVCDPARPVHSRLLSAGIPIVEHLCHLDLIDHRYLTSFVPLAVVGAPSMPVRAFARIDFTTGSCLDHPSTPLA
jgi:kynurenine formamidase